MLSRDERQVYEDALSRAGGRQGELIEERDALLGILTDLRRSVRLYPNSSIDRAVELIDEAYARGIKIPGSMYKPPHG